MTDTLKQVYVKLSELDFTLVKVITPDWHVCKQAFTFKSTHLHPE
jgi:hypothetical protein